MATVLQRQLAALAATSTHQLDLKAQKAAHGKSLLFEPKVAVSQDFDTLYQICVEGFEELCALDVRFAPFYTNIFSEQSKTEEREQMTFEENKELDAVLEDFLGLVGTRLLLKPAQKAVEWLVRRFRVHEYNSDWLILTFLPYHSTPLFLSLLSILPRKISLIFRFLYPSITALENPQFHTIVQTAKSNDGFFTAFNQYVLRVAKARHHSSVLLSFWASIATQAVDGRISSAQSGRETIQKEKQEAILLQVLPILNQALSIPNVPDLILGSCMIITVLAAKGHLEDHVLDQLMEAVASGWSVSTIDARITCLAVLSQERASTDLSKGTIKKLLKCNEFIDQVILVAQRYRVDRLILGYISSCFKRLHRANGDRIDLDSVARLLKTDLLTQSQLRIVIRELLSSVKRLQDVGTLATPEQRSSLADLVTFLAESPKWSGVFHKVLAKYSFSRDDLELSLQTVIPRAIEAAPIESDGNVEMIDAHPTASEFDVAISNVADKQLTDPSFLSNIKHKDFELFAAIYILALSSEQNIKTFLVLPALRPEGTDGILPLVSFLIRVLCSQYPQVARVAALRIISDILKAADEPDQDFQCLIPYLVIALADRSSIVRRAAAECIIVLGRQFKSLLSDDKQNAKPQVLGRQSLYNSDANAGWLLSTKDASEFVEKVLLPDLEECVLDGSIVAIMLSAAIDGSSYSKISLKAASLDLKSSFRAALFTVLSSHAISTHMVNVKLRLLDILRRIGKSGSSARLQILIPALKRWIVSPVHNITLARSHGELSQSDVDLTFFRAVSPGEKEGLNLLKDVVTGQVSRLRPEVLQSAHQVLGEIWPTLKSDDRKMIALGLFEVSLSAPEDLTSSGLAMESLRSLNMSTDVLVALLDRLPNALQMPDQPPSAKRRRTSKNEMSKMISVNRDDLALALQMYTLALEIIDSSKAENHPQLLKGLFHALGEIHHYRAQTESGMVYLQGLTINSLLAIVDKLKDTKDFTVDKSVIRTDLLVECIRHTSNPQVQNAALLLVSCLAVWQPEAVLHSVMPIFTFMGTTILRQADDYSAHVIDQTVSHVVPPLVTSLRKKNKEVVRGASDLLLSFTAAFEHIPLHRRLGLFEHVTKTLGPNDCLFAIMAMIIDRYPTDNQARSFVVKLVNTFDPSVDLRAIRQYVGLVSDAFKQRRTISEVVLNLKDKSSDQIEAIANNLLEALADLLDDPLLRSRLVESFSPSQESSDAQFTAFSGLMQEAIRLSQFLNHRPSLSQSSSRVLSHIFKILPTIDLINCAQPLLKQDEDEVRRVILHSIDAQVRGLKQQSSEATMALLEFIPHVTAVIKSSDNVMLKYSAISCVDQIVERFGKKDTSYVIAAAQIITGTTALRDLDERLRVVSLHCLVTVIDVLQDEFIPLVPQVLPVALDYLSESIAQEEKGNLRDSLAKASFALINSLVEHVPFLLTSEEYLDRALKLAQATAISSVGGVCASKRNEFYKLVGRNIDAAELFAAFDRSYAHCQQNEGSKALLEYFGAIKFAISDRTKSAIVKNSSTLFDLLLKAFDHRRLAISRNSMLAVEYTSDEIEGLENVYNDVAITMIMKLNDVTFRPFFARLVEWVTSLPSKEKFGRTLRATSLYRFLTALFERLKGLVTSYSSYILEITADLLQNTPATTNDQIRLLGAILAALEQSFTHDQDDFWQSPNHFNPIAAPLVNLFTVASSSLSPALITSITALASATSATDQHKDLNSAILKLMKSDNKETRLAAVRVERSLTERLGEEWLVMVPEMMPVLGEVLEDEDADVEREGREWVTRIEEVLGEGLEF